MVSLSRRVRGRIQREISALGALAQRPANHLEFLRQKIGRTPKPVPPSRRILDYDRARLPNPALLESEGPEPLPYQSVGYPAWNLLYYSALCSLDPEGGETVVVETGTNQGFSTIVLAQAIEDSGTGGVLHTVDFSADMTTRARRNIETAGLAHRVVLHTGDSVEVLGSLMEQLERVDFAFLDASHACDHVFAEFRLLYPKLVASRAKVYFDNTRDGGVLDALFLIRRAFGGNMVHFDECSWSPPGACIWQSD